MKTTMSKYVFKESEISSIQLPEGFVIKKQKTKADKIKELQEQISLLEAAAPEGQEPSPEDVIETSRMCIIHPYYEARFMADMLKDQVKEHQKTGK